MFRAGVREGREERHHLRREPRYVHGERVTGLREEGSAADGGGSCVAFVRAFSPVPIDFFFILFAGNATDWLPLFDNFLHNPLRFLRLLFLSL